MSRTSQRDLGSSGSPIEDELEDAFNRMIDEGTQRLHRSWREVLVTEGFLIPITTVAAKRASGRQLLKLWSGTLAANLTGGWVLMWLIMRAFPSCTNRSSSRPPTTAQQGPHPGGAHRGQAWK